MVNTQENLARFMNIKDKAKKLIQMDARGEIDKVKTKAMNEGKLQISGQNDDVQFNVTNNNVNNNNNNFMPINEAPIKNSKLPIEILESMTKNKIDTSAMGSTMGNGNGSILDQINNMSNGSLLKEEKEEKKVSERHMPSNIDYSMIKMIVEDCMKKYMSSLKKSLLNESISKQNDNSLQAMKIGNKFSFITKNGDLYEANLKFIKNISNKGGK